MARWSRRGSIGQKSEMRSLLCESPTWSLDATQLFKAARNADAAANASVSADACTDGVGAVVQSPWEAAELKAGG